MSTAKTAAPPAPPTAPSPAPTPVVVAPAKSSNAPFWLIGLGIVLIIGLGVYKNIHPKKSKPRNNSEPTSQQTPSKPTQTWEVHSLKNPGDSVMVRIEYGYHIHTFNVNNKLYGCRYQGADRQVIGNGIEYNPYPVYATRFVYLSFEKEAEDIDCLLVKNGACPYDTF